ncbi:Ankyrin repeat-containing protein [Glarea lozoyensis ATCC 20868]|uniref:Ankyrin repeat-containing protein n=1 Tax=Glarea lozoyensis (strain ATCC 20868 / MF5171) TaxID=1116229 RepID=S3D8I9_GLAL2|nr:Ankyrin repeat-containing protein [Glarea lozoyensis ATCC 20868]EPE28306.1 Ankyrin repeat-containing protein [Glarea lozoyensis ATCC 20868]
MKQRRGHLPIHVAASSTPEVLKLLLEKGAEPDIAVDQEGSRDHGSTPLSLACHPFTNNAQIAQILLDAGANPNKDMGGSQTIFLSAVFSANVWATKLLLDSGSVDLKLPVHANTPALLVAASMGHAEICKILLDAGFDANIAATDDNDYTPLHNAAGYGNGETVKVLVDGKANIEARTLDGRRPLHMACFKGKLDCVKVLLQSGAEIDSVDENGWTSLHFAARYGHMKIVKLLLQPTGSKPAALGMITTGGPGENMSGCTAADLARSNGHHAIAEFLVEAESV